MKDCNLRRQLRYDVDPAEMRLAFDHRRAYRMRTGQWPMAGIFKSKFFFRQKRTSACGSGRRMFALADEPKSAPPVRKTDALQPCPRPKFRCSPVFATRLASPIFPPFSPNRAYFHLINTKLSC